jgi:hypothetical protein
MKSRTSVRPQSSGWRMVKPNRSGAVTGMLAPGDLRIFG